MAQWYRTRTEKANPGARKTMIVALARKLLIALWRFVTSEFCALAGTAAVGDLGRKRF